MSTSQLVEELKHIERKNQEKDWLVELNERKKKELDFHNRHRDRSVTANLPQDTYEAMHGNKRFYATVQLSERYIDDWLIEHSPGKVFLDYACGNGGYAIRAASSGAELAIGLDISDVSVQNAGEAAKKAGVAEKCLFLQGDCEQTGLPDECADVIICSGMLHHLDLSYAFPELRRVLKKGGVILAVEALDYNPCIKLYRNLTPSMRTEWEKSHILSFKDLEFARRFFEIGEVRYWHLFSIAGAFLHRWPSLMKAYLKVADALDRFFLSLPLVRRMAWQFTFELRRRTND